MPETPQKFFLTTPIYYVNARPHIGHAYTTIVADVLARRSRAQGVDTYFLTGTDEHGQKIERSAAAAGIPPQQFADEVSATFSTLWRRMGITHDDFIRTTSARHKRGVQKLFQTLKDNGKIELRSYTGSYCVSDEAFVDLPAGTPCPDCGRPLETVTEQNYFFKLSEYQLPLINLIESGELAIQPESRRNEVLSFLRGPVSEVMTASLSDAEPFRPDQALSEPAIRSGALSKSTSGQLYVPGALKDLSISRTSFKWGIPVPGDESHVIYVWLDALANYMTALGYGAGANGEDGPLFQKFWPADLHIVGKEIIRFHCVYWPAFLLAAGLPLPKQVVAHGWLLFEESKMSKSRGNIVRTETILDAFGPLCPPPQNHPHGSPELQALRGGSTGLQSLPEGNTELQGLPAGSNKLESLPDGSAGLQGRSGGGTGLQGPPEGNTGLQSLPGGSTKLQNLPGGNTELQGRPEGITELRGLTGGSVGLQPRELGHQSAGALAPGTSSPAPQNPVILSEGSRGSLREPESKDPDEAALAPSDPTFLPQNSRPSDNPQTILKHHQDLFAADILRYFLLREIPFGQDGSFSFDALITRYNADLANGYGNLVSRTLKMIETNRAATIPQTQEPWIFQKDPGLTFISEIERAAQALVATAEVIDLISKAPHEIDKDSLKHRFDHATLKLAAYVKAVDIYLSSHEPWKLAKSAEIQDQRKFNEVLYTAAESIRIITALLYPILPYATASVWRQLGLGDIERAASNGELKNLQWGGLKPGTRLGPLSPIFPRADKGLAQIMTDMENPAPIACVTGPNDPPAAKLSAITAQHDANTPATDDLPVAPVASKQSASSVQSAVGLSFDPAAPPRTANLAEPNPGAHVGASAATTTERPGTPSHTEAQASGIFASHPADSSPQITIDDFAKVELRVAQVLVCERIPKADKLLRLEVDLGYEKRQILSGIAEWYTPEELIGRRIVVITNLAPRKMRGLESHGMLLAASTEGGKPHLATFTDADSLPLGSRLK